MVKELFERNACRLNDKLNYAVRDGDDLNLYQKSGILERFSHLLFEEQERTRRVMLLRSRKVHLEMDGRSIQECV